MYLEIGVSFCLPPPQSFFSNFSPTTQHRKANEVSIQHIFFRGTRWHHRCLGICQCLADPFVMAFPGLSSPNTTLIITKRRYKMKNTLYYSGVWQFSVALPSLRIATYRNKTQNSIFPATKKISGLGTNEAHV